MTDPAPLSPDLLALLTHLHRGGAYGHWWTLPGARSHWWPAGQPAPLPRGRRHVFFGVHPVTRIPPTNAAGTPTPPHAVRSQLPYVAAINCLFAELDAKDYVRVSEPEIPPLPEGARLPASEGRDACPWLDAYVRFSRRWSPMSFDGFHEAVGLWILSTIAARRVTFHFGKARYTNLYMMLAGRTTMHAKSTATGIGRHVLRQCGLDYLLAPDDTYPELVEGSDAAELFKVAGQRRAGAVAPERDRGPRPGDAGAPLRDGEVSGGDDGQ